MNSPDCSHKPVAYGKWYLEVAVPAIAFSVTIAGILLAGTGIAIDFQFFSAGCLISSCILAYLAWIRPRKDIVALSTPIYGIVFLVTPIDVSSGAILQLLYAAGLTILLVRLKHRFSAAPSAGSAVLSPEEPLGRYRERMAEKFTQVPHSAARSASIVVIQFAQGEYDKVRSFAETAYNDPTTKSSDFLNRAFAVVAEQTDRMISGDSCRDTGIQFLPEQQPDIFFPDATAVDPEQKCSILLDNALILLYIVAISNPDNGHEITENLDTILPFIRKLCGN